MRKKGGEERGRRREGRGGEEEGRRRGGEEEGGGEGKKSRGEGRGYRPPGATRCTDCIPFQQLQYQVYRSSILYGNTQYISSIFIFYIRINKFLITISFIRWQAI